MRKELFTTCRERLASCQELFTQCKELLPMRKELITMCKELNSMKLQIFFNSALLSKLLKINQFGRNYEK